MTDTTTSLDSFPLLLNDMNKLRDRVLQEYLSTQLQYLREISIEYKKRKADLKREYESKKSNLQLLNERYAKSKELIESRRMNKMKKLAVLDEVKAQFEEYSAISTSLQRDIDKKNEDLASLKNDIVKLTNGIRKQETRDSQDVRHFERILNFQIQALPGKEHTLMFLFDNKNYITFDISERLIVDIHNTSEDGANKEIRNKDQLQTLLSNGQFKQFIIESRKTLRQAHEGV